MGFEDRFRMSVHAVIFNERDEVLLLKANYGDKNWGLPGGALEPGETVHEALERECQEELGQKVIINELTGVYYHKAFESQVILFKCEIDVNQDIIISNEHLEHRYFPILELSPVQQKRVQDTLNFNGCAVSRKF